MQKLYLFGLFIVLSGFIYTVNQLDDELNAALNNASNGKGNAAFILPDSEDYAKIPQDPLNPISDEKVRLGKLLFHETALGLENKKREGQATYSCATCHFAGAGFQANAPQGIGEGGIGISFLGGTRRKSDFYEAKDIDVQPIRSPTVINSAFQQNMLWNGQFGATGVNVGTEDKWTKDTPKENNHLGFEGVEIQAIAGLGVHRMRVDEETVTKLGYKDMFDRAFSNKPAAERYSIINAGLAIAAYERTVLSNQAPFQRYLKGDRQAMTDHQKQGAITFFTKGKCASCHTGPALNKMEFHALGMKDLFQNQAVIHNSNIDNVENRGRGGFTGKEEELYEFKVPQLYNLKDSEFFGHGASFKSVREVIEYKNRAVKENPIVQNHQLSNQFVPLHLSHGEINAMVDFIENALHDPNLKRFEPETVFSGNCIPNNDAESKKTLNCVNSYCNSNGKEPWQEWIARVKLADLDNTSSKEAQGLIGHGAFLHLSANVNRGQTYEIELHPGFSWVEYEENWGVWIDFNQNEAFESEEMVVNAKGSKSQKISFTIPANSKLGNTQMRVSMNRDHPARPCGSFQNGEVEDYTIRISGGVTPPPPPPSGTYCSANGQEPWQEWIARVKLADLDHSSTKEWDPIGYGDFTNFTANISKGKSYNLELHPGYSWFEYEENWGVWIDFNQNGSFSDAGEMVANVKGSKARNISINIPNNSRTGKTRMRVAMNREKTPNACGTFKNGEVEDYTVHIGDGGVTPPPPPFNFDTDLIVTGNRVNGDISVINVETDQSITIKMPDAPKKPDFMYVNYDIHTDRVFVGDRANNRILALNAADFSMAGQVNLGADKGMFHMWISPDGNQIWSVLDVSKELAVINPRDLSIQRIIPIPAEFSNQGGKPHDIIVSPDNKYVYVTIVGGTLKDNYVVQYSTNTFREVNRAKVGIDPHVSLTPANNKLYVASQKTNQLHVLDRNTMQILKVIPFEGAHGMGMTYSGKHLYISNLPNKGKDAIGTFDLTTETFIGNPVAAFQVVPHNLAVSADDRKLYVTHTADAVNKVTVYNISPNNPIPQFHKEIEVGFKPMGIALVSDRITTPPPPPPTGEYCQANGEEPWQEWIARVKLADLDHSSTKEWGPLGYGDFTNFTANISKGKSYNLELQPGYSWFEYEENWGVWIDFNQNGSFSDAGEMVANVKGSKLRSVSINIPNNSRTGKTRMRVAMNRQQTPSPCGTFKYGEVEDYTVHIEEGNVTPPPPFNFDTDLIVTGNRVNGDISVINVETDQSITIKMPDAPKKPDFMYVNYDIHTDRVFVGDRANNRILALNAADFSMAGQVNLGADKGMFHMWISPDGNQIWSVLDVSKELAVINPRDLSIQRIIPIPAEFSNQGGKPHDIIVSPDNKYVYVTIVGGTLKDNYVVQYSTNTFREVNRAKVGIDPHVSLTPANNKLYVASQKTNQLHVLDRNTMQILKVIPFDGAHGMGMTYSGKYLYISNLPNKGKDAIGTFDINTETFVGSPVEAFQIVPHNLAVSADDSKLYVTHTADAVNKVTVYNISPNNPIPQFHKEIEVGFKPMGIALVSDRITTPPPPPPTGEYCQANGEEPWQEWIATVKLTNFEHTSSKEWEPIGYGDYTDKVIQVNAGERTSMELIPGYSWFEHEEHWRVWIDYNQNGSFTDPGEMVADVKGKNKQVITFTPPLHQRRGITRMRVAMSRDQAPSPCGSFKYGEVQDYSIVLKEDIGNQSRSKLTLSATQRQGEVSLTWAANLTAETDHFVLEKSTDGENFANFRNRTTLAKKELEVLKEKDNTPNIGSNYYRVKQYFKNGEVAISDIKKVEVYKEMFELSVYPNPVTDIVNINLKPYFGKSAIIHILDNHGHTVKTYKLDKIADEAFSISTNEFKHHAQSFYISVKIDGGKLITKKVLYAH